MNSKMKKHEKRDRRRKEIFAFSKMMILLCGISLVIYGQGTEHQTSGIIAHAEETSESTTEQSPEVATTEESAIVPTTKDGVVEQLNAFSEVNMCLQSGSEVLLTWSKVPCALSYEIYRKEHGQKEFTLLDIVDEVSYMDDIEKGYVYDYNIVPVAFWGSQRLTGVGALKTLNNLKIVSTDHQKYSYTEMEKDIIQLCDKFHGLVRYEVIGTTADNRKLYDVI